MIRYVVTSPLSLARLLWWYGEDELWPRALDLSPAQVASLAEDFARLRADPEGIAAAWPTAAPPLDACLLLPTIGLLEGTPRPTARRHRRPDHAMPERLDVPEDQRWRDPQVREVAWIVDAIAGEPAREDDPADRPRLMGRWAHW